MSFQQLSRPVAALMLLACAVVFVLEPWLCGGDSCPADESVEIPTRPYPNPGFSSVGRVYGRHARLLFMTQEECGFGRSVITALLFGSWIGSERRASDRPAGIMLMSLVCMGACTFCICGQFAFEHGTMAWDASRISAAIPSGGLSGWGSDVYLGAGQATGVGSIGGSVSLAAEAAPPRAAACHSSPARVGSRPAAWRSGR